MHCHHLFFCVLNPLKHQCNAVQQRGVEFVQAVKALQHWSWVISWHARLTHQSHFQSQYLTNLGDFKSVDWVADPRLRFWLSEAASVPQIGSIHSVELGQGSNINYASDFADSQLFFDSQLLIFPSQLLHKLNVVVTPSIVNTQLFLYQNKEGAVAIKTNKSRSWTGNRLSAEREPLLSSLRNQAREHFFRFLDVFDFSDVLHIWWLF